MNRRNILKGLFALPIFCLPQEKKENCENFKDTSKKAEETYKNFYLHWAGYERRLDSEVITGFWLAVNDKKKRYFYACTGGVSGEYLIGYIFNTAVVEDHLILTVRSSEEDKEKEKSLALAAIKKEIDNFYFEERK